MANIEKLNVRIEIAAIVGVAPALLWSLIDTWTEWVQNHSDTFKDSRYTELRQEGFFYKSYPGFVRDFTVNVPKIKTLQGQNGSVFSERSIRRYLAILEKHGLIVVKTQGGRKWYRSVPLSELLVEHYSEEELTLEESDEGVQIDQTPPVQIDQTPSDICNSDLESTIDIDLVEESTLVAEPQVTEINNIANIASATPKERPKTNNKGDVPAIIRALVEAVPNRSRSIENNPELFEALSKPVTYYSATNDVEVYLADSFFDLWDAGVRGYSVGQLYKTWVLSQCTKALREHKMSKKSIVSMLTNVKSWLSWCYSTDHPKRRQKAYESISKIADRQRDEKKDDGTVLEIGEPTENAFDNL